MRKVLFLDRDGVIIKERGDYNFKAEHLFFVEGIVSALKRIKEAGFEFIIITNQGGIAKGYYGHEDVFKMHSFIQSYFKQRGIHFLDWYYCPHHDISGKCLCRKPGSLMVEKAIAKNQVAYQASYFIGDKGSDYEAGLKAGVNPIQIKANDNLNNYLKLIL